MASGCASMRSSSSLPNAKQIAPCARHGLMPTALNAALAGLGVALLPDLNGARLGGAAKPGAAVASARAQRAWLWVGAVGSDVDR